MARLSFHSTAGVAGQGVLPHIRATERAWLKEWRNSWGIDSISGIHVPVPGTPGGETFPESPLPHPHRNASRRPIRKRQTCPVHISSLFIGHPPLCRYGLFRKETLKPLAGNDYGKSAKTSCILQVEARVQ